MIPVQDIGDRRSSGQDISLVHIELGHHAGGGGLHPLVFLRIRLALQQIIQVDLGLFQRDLLLLNAVLYALGVHPKEHVVLVDRIPLLEGGFQDLSLYQRRDLIGIDGLDGACTRNGHRHILPGHGNRYVGHANQALGPGHTAGEQEEDHGCNDHDNDQPLEPFAFLLGRLEGGLPLLGGGSLLLLRRFHIRYLLLNALCFWIIQSQPVHGPFAMPRLRMSNK